MRIDEANVPDDLISFVEAEAANAANLPGCTVDVFADPELARVGLARVTEALIHGGSVPRAVKEAGCFESWLQGQLYRKDATGKVARWVTQEIMMGQWQSEHILLKRFGHTCDTLAHHERRLKGRELSEESIETFFGVYDEYLADAMNGYDQKIRNIEKEGEIEMGQHDERDQEYLEKYGKTYREVMEQDKADIERWKSPGGWLWLQDKGYYDDPPDPMFLAELENGDHDEDLELGEAGELAADIRKRLKDYPGLLEGSGNSVETGSKPPF